MTNPADTRIHIAYCTDLAYVQHVGVALTSLLEHNDPAKVVVHVVSPPLPQEGIDRLNTIARQYGTTLNYVPVDASVVASLREHLHISRAMYYRILLPKLVDLDKIIYFDCDMLMEADVGELWDMDVEGCGCAGVDEENPAQTNRLGLQGDFYINSGVLVMNLAYWREHRVAERCMEWLTANEALAILPDQDAINVILKGQKRRIPLKWNLNPVPLETIDVLKTYPSRVIHFGGAIKPWHRYYDFELQAIYKKYLDKTPWAAEFSLAEPGNMAQALVVANQYYERKQLSTAAYYYARAIQFRLVTTKLDSELLLDVINSAHRLTNSQRFDEAVALYRACFKHWGMPLQHLINIYRVPGILDKLPMAA
jgi:lipopolysaccharide biosynthesis glycosyltransferase